jgi:tetratricopeptide (TPR) repeat protein
MKPNTILRCLLALTVIIVVIAMGISVPVAEENAPDGNPKAKLAQLAALKTVLEKRPEDYAALKKTGILYSELALDDPKAYASKAVDVLNRAHEMQPSDDETLCYLGSTTTLLANTTGNPFKKSGYVNRGCGYMDKAVRRSPDNITVRMVRATNSMSLPAFLNRRSKAFEDYEYLAQRFERELGLSDDLKQTVYRNLAELYEKAGDTDRAEKYRQLVSAR